MEDKEISLFRDHILKGQYDSLFKKEGGDKKDANKYHKIHKNLPPKDGRQKYNMSIF